MRLASLGLVSLGLACGPSPGETDAGAGQGTGPASVTTGTTGPGGTSASTQTTGEVDSSGTTSGGSSETGTSGCGPNPCGPCSPECTPIDACVDGRWQCDCDCPVDEGPPPPACPSLDEVLAEWTALGKEPATDCGFATLGDDVEEWLTVQSCIGEHLTTNATFFARWQTDDEDPYELAVAGRAGAVYETAWWELTGFGTLTQYTCDGAGVLDACLVVVGDMCVRCGRPSQPTILCDPK